MNTCTECKQLYHRDPTYGLDTCPDCTKRARRARHYLKHRDAINAKRRKGAFIPNYGPCVRCGGEHQEGHTPHSWYCSYDCRDAARRESHRKTMKVYNAKMVAAPRANPKRVKEIFNYYKDTGILTKKAPSYTNKFPVNEREGVQLASKMVSVDGKKISRSAVVYCLKNGAWPARP